MKCIEMMQIQLGITSGFPDYGFPGYFCHYKYVLHRKLGLKDYVIFALKIGPAGFSIF